MTNTFLTVPFYEDNLILLGINDEPMVVMKPIVESMGLGWASQMHKITKKYPMAITLALTFGADGKNREMLCLSLRKLPAWLYSIHPTKVKPEIKDKIVLYQNECDETLWRHWQQARTNVTV